jgi:hypothetical protein
MYNPGGDLDGGPKPGPTFAAVETNLDLDRGKRGEVDGGDNR